MDPELRKQLKKTRSKLFRLRRSGARNLGRFDCPEARAALVERLMIDRSVEVQLAAQDSLAQLKGDDALRALNAALNGNTFQFVEGDGTPGELDRIVKGAALALAKVGTVQAATLLLDALQVADLSPGHRLFAGGGGGLVIDKGGIILTSAMKSALDACPRDVLLEAASRHGNPRVREAIVSHWGRPDEK